MDAGELLWCRRGETRSALQVCARGVACFHTGAKKLATGNFFLTLSSSPCSLCSQNCVFLRHKKNNLTVVCLFWCRRGDSNPHEVALGGF